MSSRGCAPSLRASSHPPPKAWFLVPGGFTCSQLLGMSNDLWGKYRHSREVQGENAPTHLCLFSAGKVFQGSSSRLALLPTPCWGGNNWTGPILPCWGFVGVHSLTALACGTHSHTAPCRYAHNAHTVTFCSSGSVPFWLAWECHPEAWSPRISIQVPSW